tara:strand:+ start:1051 stop:1416 length:366 start_codon:yes stop_codon:yes gene_type:complete
MYERAIGLDTGCCYGKKVWKTTLKENLIFKVPLALYAFRHSPDINCSLSTFQLTALVLPDNVIIQLKAKQSYSLPRSILKDNKAEIEEIVEHEWTTTKKLVLGGVAVSLTCVALYTLLRRR